MTDILPIRTALLSVADKTGLVDFAKGLAASGIALVSTGGTAAALRKAGLGVRDVSDLTDFPEIMGGRVKTLHPMIHGGILADRGQSAHLDALATHGIQAIDLVVVNLYPFEATVARGASQEDCVETIDIGGPALLRAAAKNHGSVTVLSDPQDYETVLTEIAEAGGTRLATRRRLAAVAFGRTGAYDAAVAQWMNGIAGKDWPRRRLFASRRIESLRYGENPHQQAAFYADGSARPGVATATLLQGKALSYNNINDTDAAYELVAEFGMAQAGRPAACVIVKHANPCGVATGVSLAEAVTRAQNCDQASAFGGVVALNGEVDGDAAAAILRLFTEVVIAPAADAAARARFAEKPNLRLMVTEALPDPNAARTAIRQVAGGLLIQDADAGRLTAADLKRVTRRAPSEAETQDLLFAWRVAKHVKSNAIVYAKDGATVGIGAGQMSRVDSARIAARKAAEMGQALGLAELPTRGAAVASDAFFPFADGLLAAAEAGASAVIQPGGSVRDAEVIEAADAAGLAMVFTGMRHFRH